MTADEVRWGIVPDTAVIGPVSMPRAEISSYKPTHVVLGQIFLKYISDAFEARHEYLRAPVDDPKDEYFLRPDVPNRAEAVEQLLEDKDEYKAVSIFWVPKEARWDHLKANAPQPKIGTIVDDAMAASSGITHRSRACCQRITAVPVWTSSGWGN